MMDYPQELKKGDPITAEWLNTLLEKIQSNDVVSTGPGLLMDRGVDGKHLKLSTGGAGVGGAGGLRLMRILETFDGEAGPPTTFTYNLTALNGSEDAEYTEVEVNSALRSDAITYKEFAVESIVLVGFVYDFDLGEIVPLIMTPELPDTTTC